MDHLANKVIELFNKNLNNIIPNWLFCLNDLFDNSQRAIIEPSTPIVGMKPTLITSLGEDIMTSVSPPDYHVTLDIDLDIFEAISGCYLDVTIVVEGETIKLEGMFCIPQGATEDFELGLCDAWLWINAGGKIAPKAKVDITIIRISPIELMQMDSHSIDPYLHKHLFGYVEG